MDIIDDFLEQKDFDELHVFMMSDNFDWYYNATIDFQEDLNDANKFQFVHMFYYAHAPHSRFIEQLDPILNILQPIAIFRIKANLLTRTPNIIENEFHIDNSDLSEEKLKHWTTSIFYVNTNNGHTIFEDGTKVESVANRMITFPTNMKHTGTSCTDEKTRVVINFNYFSKYFCE